MRKRYLALGLLLLCLNNINSYAEPATAPPTEETTNDIAETEDLTNLMGGGPSEEIETAEDAPPVEEPELPMYDESLAFAGNAGTTYRYEVFYDRNFPDIFFCLQNGTNVKYAAKDMEEDKEGTSIEIRTVESISGQNFSVIYFTCGVEGAYTIEYSESDCSTFVLVETEINNNYKTILRETRLPVKRVFYDIIGPYTEVDLDTLLDPEYDPLSTQAADLIQDEVVDNNIYIPINFFTVSLVLAIIGGVVFYFARKRYLKMKAIEENIIHKDLLDSISSSQIADEEQNEELKDYWNIIKNDYIDI